MADELDLLRRDLIHEIISAQATTFVCQTLLKSSDEKEPSARAEEDRITLAIEIWLQVHRSVRVSIETALGGEPPRSQG